MCSYKSYDMYADVHTDEEMDTRVLSYNRSSG